MRAVSGLNASPESHRFRANCVAAGRRVQRVVQVPRAEPSPSVNFAAMAPAELPSPDEIVAREARTRRIAAIAAAAGSALVVAAIVIDQVSGSTTFPDRENAVDLIQTLAAQRDGAPFPPSYNTQVGREIVDAGAALTASSIARGLAIILWMPMIAVLLRGARERGGQIARFLEPLASMSMLIAGVLFAVAPIARLVEYNGLEDDGFPPNAVLDISTDPTIATLDFGLSIATLLLAVPIALGAIQAMRVGLVPRIFGFMGVLVGMLFVLPFDPSFLLRAFWFLVIAAVVSGRLPGGAGLPKAWETGTAVEPEPRQPPQLREPKASKAGKK